MTETAIASAVREVLAVSSEEFQRRVEADAEHIKSELAAGTFDNPQGLVGLEYEFYAATAGTSTADSSATWYGRADEPRRGALRRIPRRTLSFIGFEKELGLHNAEMCTTPQPLNEHGLAAQEAEVKSRLVGAREAVHANDMRLVSDGMWTIPPIGETARAYLTDAIEDDGLRIATNMSDAVRYHAMGNTAAPTGMRLDAPGVFLQAETIMPESLITSIQPHYQVPQADTLPSYFGYAIRIAGPLLALGVNSPFFPPSLYDDDVTPQSVLDDAWMGNRIRVFETALNTEAVQKVKFPTDIETVEAAVDRIVADETIVPMPVERGDRFDDEFAHFRQKHGTYWRWVRPVFGGSTRSEANARIEFRPIAGQPTVRDSIAFQATFAGALEGLRSSQHPLREMDWATARDNFYAAMRDGLDADLTWISADGEITTDSQQLYEELFDVAADGLRAQGLEDDQIDRFLEPLRGRVRMQRTPAEWKHGVATDRVEAGDSLAEALWTTQRAYLDRQSETLLSGTLTDWNTP